VKEEKKYLTQLERSKVTRRTVNSPPPSTRQPVCSALNSPRHSPFNPKLFLYWRKEQHCHHSTATAANHVDAAADAATTVAVAAPQNGHTAQERIRLRGPRRRRRRSAERTGEQGEQESLAHIHHGALLERVQRPRRPSGQVWEVGILSTDPQIPLQVKTKKETPIRWLNRTTHFHLRAF